LAVVTVVSDIVGMLWKMPHIFINTEYVDMMNDYGFCGGSVPAAVEKYRRRCFMRRIPGSRVFPKVFHILDKRGTLPSFL
jgi:hypothetical protein